MQFESLGGAAAWNDGVRKHLPPGAALGVAALAVDMSGMQCQEGVAAAAAPVVDRTASTPGWLIAVIIVAASNKFPQCHLFV